MTPEQLIRRAGDERTEYEVQLAEANREIARLRSEIERIRAMVIALFSLEDK